MTLYKTILTGLVAVMLALVGLTGAPASRAEVLSQPLVTSQTESMAFPLIWDLAEDFRVWPNQANPNPDSYGNTEVWSFMYSTTMHDPSTYSLTTEFVPNVLDNAGWQGWLGPDNSSPLSNNGLPRVSMNTTGMPMDFAPVILPPGVIEVHPDPSQPAIVGWHSPFTGAIAVSGGVTDLNNLCGDGIQWFIDKNSTTVASGSFVNGGSQLFQDGTGGNQLGNVPVNEGDSVYFLIAPGGDYNCDWTQLDVTITMVSISKPGAPTLASPANGATVAGSQVTLDWDPLPFATHYKVLVKDKAKKTAAALTVFEASQIKLGLKRNETYSWHVKACNSGGCSAKSEVWTFSK